MSILNALLLQQSRQSDPVPTDPVPMPDPIPRPQPMPDPPPDQEPIKCVNAKQKCHLRCETEMSCFGSENAFDRLAIYFRAFSFPNRNHENDNFLVYNLVYKAIA